MIIFRRKQIILHASIWRISIVSRKSAEISKPKLTKNERRTVANQIFRVRMPEGTATPAAVFRAISPLSKLVFYLRALDFQSILSPSSPRRDH